MLMGLFPQAGLAWMALDDTVYLWSFRSTATTYGPDGQPAGGSQFLQLTVPGGAGATAVGGAGAAAPATSSSVGNRPIIVSVGLAPPKPGEFKFVNRIIVVVRFQYHHPTNHKTNHFLTRIFDFLSHFPFSCHLTLIINAFL
jgi:hypothetical protein